MRKLAAAVTLAATMAVVPASPASATSHDCVILGPDYVSEVVDCAIYIYEIAIGWPDSQPPI